MFARIVDNSVGTYAYLHGMFSTLATAVGVYPTDPVAKIFSAAAQGDLACVQELIEQQGVSIDVVQTLENQGLTLLHCAIRANQAAVFSYCLARGINPNTIVQSPGLTGFSPLYEAALFKRLDLARELLNLDVDVEGGNKYAVTPLSIAARCPDNVDMLRLLVKHHADVNYQAVNGVSPLHHAMHSRCVANIRFLLNYGARLEAEDAFGNTPLSIYQGICEWNKQHPEELQLESDNQVFPSPEMQELIAQFSIAYQVTPVTTTNELPEFLLRHSI